MGRYEDIGELGRRVASNVRQRREIHGWTPEQLAERIGRHDVDGAAVTAFETWHRPIVLIELALLAIALECDLLDLLRPAYELHLSGQRG